MTPGGHAAHLIHRPDTGASGSRLHAHRQRQRPPSARARAGLWRRLQGGLGPQKRILLLLLAEGAPSGAPGAGPLARGRLDACPLSVRVGFSTSGPPTRGGRQGPRAHGFLCPTRRAPGPHPLHRTLGCCVPLAVPGASRVARGGGKLCTSGSVRAGGGVGGRGGRSGSPSATASQVTPPRSRHPERVPLDGAVAPPMPSGPSSRDLSLHPLREKKGQALSTPAPPWRLPGSRRSPGTALALLRLGGAGRAPGPRAPCSLPECRAQARRGPAQVAEAHGSGHEPSRGSAFTRVPSRDTRGDTLVRSRAQRPSRPPNTPLPPRAARCPILSRDSPRGQPDPEGPSAQRQRSAAAPGHRPWGRQGGPPPAARGPNGSRAPAQAPALDSSRGRGRPGRGNPHARAPARQDPCSSEPSGTGPTHDTAAPLSRQAAQIPGWTPHRHITCTLTNAYSFLGHKRSQKNHTHSQYLSLSRTPQTRSITQSLAKCTLTITPMNTHADSVSLPRKRREITVTRPPFRPQEVAYTCHSPT